MGGGQTPSTLTKGYYDSIALVKTYFDSIVGDPTSPVVNSTIKGLILELQAIAEGGALDSEIAEHHFHSFERWLGASGGGIAPGLETSLTGFRITSAAVANTFGTSVQILDGTETPLQSGEVSFDFHRIQIISVENNDKIYRIRFANNSEGHTNYADAVAAGVYSDIAFRVTKGTGNSPVLPIVTMRIKRVSSGTIFWAAVATADAVAQYIDFLVGIHEYDESA